MINDVTPDLWLAMVQSFTKTFSMMLGEVEADSIITKERLPVNFLLLFFEITAAILLTNLLISLAVGDVANLVQDAENQKLRIKVQYCLDYLHEKQGLKCRPLNQTKFRTPLCRCLPMTFIAPPEYIVVVKNKQLAYHVTIKDREKIHKQDILDTEFWQKFLRWIIGLDWTMADIDFEKVKDPEEIKENTTMTGIY